MTISDLERAQRYAALCHKPTTLERSLGTGNDGSVWESNRGTAIKAIRNVRNYFTERDCYQRFSEYGIGDIHGFSIPALDGWDDTLQVIEIGMVEPPYVIDFAKAYLDFPPIYPDDAIEDEDRKLRRLFGKNYPTVMRIIRELESVSIYYVDANPGNIKFGHLSLEESLE